MIVRIERLLLFLLLAGTVTGIEAPTFRNLRLTPVVLGQVLESGVRPVHATFDPDVGADVKYSVTPSLVLDATVVVDEAGEEAIVAYRPLLPDEEPFPA